MNTLTTHSVWPIKDMAWPLNNRDVLAGLLACLLFLFISAGLLLQAIDPAAGIMDIGILSVLLFAVLVSMLGICCCYWLQEMLWQPFKYFRKHFINHFNQLTTWQQCILYFAVFFLLLFSVLCVLAIVF